MAVFTENIHSAVVEVTNRCNLRCPHCASASGCARADELSLSEMRDVIHDLSTLGCQAFTMLGGEFLLRPDWYEIGQAVKAEGIELQLITNGLLATPETRAQFKALDPQTVCVSLDGATPEGYRATRGVDGFAKCRRLLDDLVADGFRQVSAITTFSARNLDEFDLFVEQFVDTSIVWQIQIAHRAGERFDDGLLLSRDQYKWLVGKATRCLNDLNGRLRLQVMDDFGYFPFAPELRFLCQTWDGCAAGRRVIGIRANGDVLPCLSLGTDYVEDNLRRRPLVDIWRDPDSFPRFRGKTSADLTGVCAKCAVAEKCRAGCSAAALSTTGTLGETRFCIRQLETESMLEDLLG